MPDAARTAAGTYSGALYRTTGPAFNVTPWAGTVGVTQVGNGTFTFSDGDNGTFAYTLDGSKVSSFLLGLTIELSGRLPLMNTASLVTGPLERVVSRRVGDH